eukprot:scaffold1438_cov173-Ochromonas_danica.AAC.3
MSDLVDYAFSILPLVAGHLCVPPLSCFQFVAEAPPVDLMEFFHFLYRQLPPQLLDGRFVQSLMLDKDDKSINITLLTHLFVHSSYSHLLGNLSQLVLLGWPVFKQFGGVGVYFMVLVGGICGSANVYEQYFKSVATTSRALPSGPPAINQLLGSAVNVVQSVLESVQIKPKLLACGSSGGIFALYGCNMVLVVKQLGQDIWSLRKANKEKKSSNEALARILNNSIYLLGCVSVLQAEIIGVEAQHQQQERWLYYLWSARTITGHSAHLQGFAFGLVATSLSLICSSQ